MVRTLLLLGFVVCLAINVQGDTVLVRLVGAIGPLMLTANTRASRRYHDNTF